jgi:ABC-type lipoprotein export system ATPase subunit
MTAVVDVRDAFRIYRSDGAAAPALQGLTLTIEPEEIVVVLGPSGSGKTTLLRAVAGLEPLSAGSIRVLGRELCALSARERADFRAANVGFLDQHYSRTLSPDLSCLDTVALQLGLLGVARSDAHRVSVELLAEVGLPDRANDRPQTLSGGEQQRVAVCAAVAHKPRLLLADEPAGELDAESAATVYALLGQLTRATRASALIVSHDAAAAEIADRLIRIRDGRVVAQALPGTAPHLVVSNGWLRVPTAFFDEHGKNPGLVDAEPREGGVLLRPVEDSSSPPSPERRRAARRTPPDRSGPIVQELRDVAKFFGARVVFSGFSRRVAAGRLLAVVGRSGTGKTTLLHLLAGLERPTSGDVLFHGQPLSAKNRSELATLRRRHMALVTQEPGLVPYLTALENVELGLGMRGSATGNEARAQAALADVGLGQRLDHRATFLSAGERQRVAIARALASEVDMLLVDEPTARLDEKNARAIGVLLAAAAREQRRAVVCATHDPVLVERADEIVDLERLAQP